MHDLAYRDAAEKIPDWPRLSVPSVVCKTTPWPSKEHFTFVKLFLSLQTGKWRKMLDFTEHFLWNRNSKTFSVQQLSTGDVQSKRKALAALSEMRSSLRYQQGDFQNFISNAELSMGSTCSNYLQAVELRRDSRPACKLLLLCGAHTRQGFNSRRNGSITCCSGHHHRDVSIYFCF